MENADTRADVIHLTRVTLARALKEKKRLAGEAARLQMRIRAENENRATIQLADGKVDRTAVLADETVVKHKQKLERIMSELAAVHERLVCVKTEISHANADIAGLLVMLSETKSELAFLETILCGEDYAEPHLGPSGTPIVATVCSYAFNSEWRGCRRKELTRTINELQDRIDEYNATHYVEIPLSAD